MPSAASMNRLRAFVPAIIMGMGAFIATFDVTAVSLALPVIGRTFGLEVRDTVWIMNAYSLAFTIMLITAGALSDRFGHRLALVGGAATFLVASLVCAFAPSYAVLVGGRVLQGVAAAFIVCGGYALMGRMYTEKAQRVRAFAIIGTLGGSALAVGPGLGGIIASTVGWTWVFLINVPVCLLIIAGTLGGMKEYRNPDPGGFDVPGILTFSLFLMLSAWVLMNGPTIGGITLGAVEIVGILLALAVGFVWAERRAKKPAVDVALFRSETFVGLAVVPLALAVSYWSLIVYMPIFLESALDLPLHLIAHIMLFFTLPMFLVPYLVTGIATRARPSTFYAGGLAGVTLGCLCLAAAAMTSGALLAAVGMVVAGIGAAAIQTQVSGALIASAPADRAGGVSAIMTVLRQGGFAIGTAFLSMTMDIGGRVDRLGLDPFALLFLVCAMVAGTGMLGTRVLVRRGEQRQARVAA